MSTKDLQIQKSKGLLAAIEKAGNKMPNPFALFMWLVLVVMIASAICSWTGVKVTHPSTGAEITVVNLFSVHGLLWVLANFIRNFQNMPILGSIIIFTVVCGICERTGLFTSAIKMGLKNAKGSLVVFIIAMIGCFSNQAGDVAFIIVPTIAAVIFIGMGRHPVAGIFAGYAAVGGGFGTEILPAFLSSVLTPVSVEAAQMIQPGFTMSPLNGYFALLTSAILVSIAVTFVTTKIVEPRLGKNNASNADSTISTAPVEELTEVQKKATKAAGISLLIFLLLIVVACIPSNSFFRGPGGTLLTGSPLMNSVIGLLILMFLIPGITYAIASKQMKNINDFVGISVETVKGIAPFIVMAIMIGQFLAMFTYSNLGMVIAIGGGLLLQASSLPLVLIMVLFICVVMIVDIFFGSGSAKFLIFGPIFVPMFMQLNVHPALTQMAYRMGDCITNSLSPFSAFFPMCVAMCQKYDKNVGMGNFFSAMFSYCVAFFIVLVVQLVVWIVFQIPTGPTGGIWLNP